MLHEQIDYKHIHFVKIRELKKTTAWSCRTNRDECEIGIVKWYPRWRRYCYFSEPLTIYSPGCLGDIREFLEYLQKQERG